MITGAIQCFCCDLFLVVDTAPVMVMTSEGQQLRPPRLAAPFICEVCREDPTKLKATREEMFKYIGPEQLQDGFDG